MGYLSIAFGLQDEDTWDDVGPAVRREPEESWDTPADDWALVTEAPDPEGSVSAELEDRTKELLAVFAGGEDHEYAGTVEKTVSVFLHRHIVPELPRKVEVRRYDANLEERESWLRWAARKHPEWKPLRVPRRLTPRWVTEEYVAQKGQSGRVHEALSLSKVDAFYDEGRKRNACAFTTVGDGEALLEDLLQFRVDGLSIKDTLLETFQESVPARMEWRVKGTQATKVLAFGSEWYCLGQQALRSVWKRITGHQES